MTCLAARRYDRIDTPSIVLRLLSLALVLVISVASAHAEEGFAKCAQAFAADDVQMAPQRTRFLSGEGPGDFVPLCYRLGENAFFAVEYSTKRLMADWVAHRLENRFGTDGCGSIPVTI
jgi:hypothetical protein